jgi:hypothetical protein
MPESVPIMDPAGVDCKIPSAGTFKLWQPSGAPKGFVSEMEEWFKKSSFGEHWASSGFAGWSDDEWWKVEQLELLLKAGYTIAAKLGETSDAEIWPIESHDKCRYEIVQGNEHQNYSQGSITPAFLGSHMAGNYRITRVTFHEWNGPEPPKNMGPHMPNRFQDRERHPDAWMGHVITIPSWVTWNTINDVASSEEMMRSNQCSIDPWTGIGSSRGELLLKDDETIIHAHAEWERYPSQEAVFLSTLPLPRLTDGLDGTVSGLIRLMEIINSDVYYLGPILFINYPVHAAGLYGG